MDKYYKDEIHTYEMVEAPFGSGSTVVVKPSEWIKKYEGKEQDAFQWLFQYFIEKSGDEVIPNQDQDLIRRMRALKNARGVEDLTQSSNIRVMSEMDNLASDGVSTAMTSKIRYLTNPNFESESKHYITQLTRKKLDKKGRVVDEAIILAIFYTIDEDDDSIVYVNYISRFWQGIDFQLRIQKRDHNNYEKIRSDAAFMHMLQKVKDFGAKVLKIEIISEGSKQLVERHLGPSYSAKLWHRRPKVKDSTKQFFPLKYMEYRMCNQCLSKVATVAWKDPDYAFCGKECAKIKWKSL